MLSYIRGTVTYKDAEGAIIEAGGIGYELSMSIHALASLSQVGATAQVWTYLSVKDDGIALFGFADPAEKNLFVKLIAVSGIGPKMALSALSTFRPAELVNCIAAGDVSAISTIPGVGKKTAQRMILDLQGILKTDASLDASSIDGVPHARDAIRALESMGFTAEEARASLADCTESTLDGIIRHALKHLGGAR